MAGLVLATCLFVAGTPITSAVYPAVASADGVAKPPSTQSGAVHPPSRLAGSWSARIVAPSRVLSRPGGGRQVARLGTATTWSRHSQSLLVLDSAIALGRSWLRVRLPGRPNRSAGWISQDRVALRHSDIWVEIHKPNRSLLVFLNGKRILRTRIVIGASDTPTPAGLFAIYERNRQADQTGFLGPWSLPITAFSPTLKSFGGGPGRVALHGRGGDSFLDPLGSAASHGCVRVPNRTIRWLARNAGPGSPVLIRGY